MVNIILIGIIDLKMSSTSLISKVSKDINVVLCRWESEAGKFAVKPVDHCEGQIATVKQQCKVRPSNSHAFLRETHAFDMFLMLTRIDTTFSRCHACRFPME